MSYHAFLIGFFVATVVPGFAAALMVLVGFILPWFTSNLASIISGSFSGLAVLVQLIFATFASLIGLITETQSDQDIFGRLSVGILIVLNSPTAFVALVPFDGYRLGRAV